MNNTSNNQLSFPQRNWLLLCILVAIISIGLTHLVESKQRNIIPSIEIRTDQSSATGNDSVGIPPDSLRH